MSLGTVVFSDEVLGQIDRCELRNGVIILVASIMHPHPAFNVNVWRIHGADGELIYTVRAAGREPMVIRAGEGCCGETIVILPVAFTGGDMVTPVIGPSYRGGIVEYR